MALINTTNDVINLRRLQDCDSWTSQLVKRLLDSLPSLKVEREKIRDWYLRSEAGFAMLSLANLIYHHEGYLP
jgi:hypothetical protein